jgi:hypothetical protein
MLILSQALLINLYMPAAGLPGFPACLLMSSLYFTADMFSSFSMYY